MTLSLTVPGSLGNFEDELPTNPTSPSGPSSQDLIVFGLFGSATEAKDDFFRTVCEASPEARLGDALIRRGVAVINGVQAHILEFPDLYEASSVRDSDNLLHVGQYLGKYAEGRLRGAIYMCSSDDTDQERRSIELFKALVGEEALNNSTLVVHPRPAHRSPLQNELFDNVPGLSLLDISVEHYHCVLEQFIGKPPFSTLYQQEKSSGAVLVKTTVGRLLDSYLSEDERRVTCARARLRGEKPKTQEPPSTITTTPPRARQRVDSGLARELEETKQRLSQAETDYAAAQEQLNTHDESYLALEIGYGQLQLQNERLERMVEELQSEAELRADGTRLDPPPPHPPVAPGPTPEEIVGLHAEIESLRSDLATATTEKEAEITRLKSSNAELEKRGNGLEKKADGLQKRSEGLQTKHALDKKVKELEKEREGLTKENKAANATQDLLSSTKDKLKSTEDELKRSTQELDGLRKKQLTLADEQAKVVKLTADLLKLQEGVKKKLDSAKAQAEEQVKIEMTGLKKAIDERNSEVKAQRTQIETQQIQLAAIATAAEAWAIASAEVENLKGCMQREREQAESRYQAAQEQITRLQYTYNTERGAWDAEKIWGHAELDRLERENQKLGMELGMETMLRELEVKGYSSRITELEEWGQGRWDAIGSGCVIA